MSPFHASSSNRPHNQVEMSDYPSHNKNEELGAQTLEVSSNSDENISTVQHKDKAVQLLKEAEATGHHVIVTPEDNARILRKIDLMILPIILCIYALQSLDKTSLSYASVFGLITETHLHGQVRSIVRSLLNYPS